MLSIIGWGLQCQNALKEGEALIHVDHSESYKHK